jgi:hypothetical protein
MNRAENLESDGGMVGRQLAPADAAPADAAPADAAPADAAPADAAPGPDVVGGPGVDQDPSPPETDDVSRGMQALRHSYEETRHEATNAAVKTATNVWREVPKLLPLLGVLFYGLGRLMVDGFYTRLNTTADSAGIGYLSIVEPAAVLAAVLAVIGTAISMMFDVLKVFFLWITRYRSVLLSILGAAVALLLGFLVNLVSSHYGINSIIVGILAPILIVTLRALISFLGSSVTRKSAGPRILAVLASLIFLAALCYGAHEWGVHEAGRVTKGESVDIKIGGLEMSAISALPVRIQSIDLSPAIKQLSADGCLFEIGSGPYNFLLYDPARKDTVSVPSNAVVLINVPAC